MAEFHRVAAIAEVPAGSVTEVEANGRRLALANVDGQYYAVDNVCLHRGGPLGQGLLHGQQIECPWHAWQFDVTTGECAFNPNARQATFEVKVENGEILVAV